MMRCSTPEMLPRRSAKEISLIAIPNRLGGPDELFRAEINLCATKKNP